MKLGRQGDSDSQEQPRKETIKRDKLGRQSAKSSPEGKSERGDELERQGGSGSQEQCREIMKGDEVGRQGGCGSQEQPRMEILKGDKHVQECARDGVCVLHCVQTQGKGACARERP